MTHPTGRETFSEDGKRFPMRMIFAKACRSSLRGPHSIQRKVVIAIELTGSGFL
jgi:hypothetical protein